MSFASHPDLTPPVCDHPDEGNYNLPAGEENGDKVKSSRASLPTPWLEGII